MSESKPKKMTLLEHPYISFSPFLSKAFLSWPIAFQEYVVRTLYNVPIADPNCVSKEEVFLLQVVDAKLEGLWRKTVNDNSFVRTDWSVMPIPLIDRSYLPQARRLPMPDTEQLAYIRVIVRMSFTFEKLRAEAVKFPELLLPQDRIAKFDKNAVAAGLNPLAVALNSLTSSASSASSASSLSSSSAPEMSSMTPAPLAVPARNMPYNPAAHLAGPSLYQHMQQACIQNPNFAASAQVGPSASGNGRAPSHHQFVPATAPRATPSVYGTIANPQQPPFIDPKAFGYVSAPPKPSSISSSFPSSVGSSAIPAPLPGAVDRKAIESGLPPSPVPLGKLPMPTVPYGAAPASAPASWASMVAGTAPIPIPATQSGSAQPRLAEGVSKRRKQHTSEHEKKQELRAARFSESLKKSVPTVSSTVNMDWLLPTSENFVGRSTELERAYLRLTGPPDPAQVRPEFVLKKALPLVLAKYKEKPEVDRYIYAFEQLKSIRQDLVIQRIRNPFTVHVYEAHARIALERANPDLSEYVQCQKNLMDLYSEGIKSKCRDEFFTYNALQLLLLNNSTELSELLRRVSVAERTRNNDWFDTKSAFWQYGIKVIRLHNSFHYAELMTVLVQRAQSGLGTALDDALLRAVRHRLWLSYLTAYRPSKLDVKFLASSLGFAVDDEDPEEACIDWLDDKDIECEEIDAEDASKVLVVSMSAAFQKEVERSSET
eukprot:ANDGO_02678.mRNA.1 THP3 homolog C2A9.11c